MKGPSYRARLAARRERPDYKVPSDSSEDSDEEWTPNMNRKKTRGSTVCIIKTLGILTAKSEQSDQDLKIGVIC